MYLSICVQIWMNWNICFIWNTKSRITLWSILYLHQYDAVICTSKNESYPIDFESNHRSPLIPTCLPCLIVLHNTLFCSCLTPPFPLSLSCKENQPFVLNGMFFNGDKALFSPFSFWYVWLWFHPVEIYSYFPSKGLQLLKTWCTLY